MNVFGECPVKGKTLEIKSGKMAGAKFEAEDWARNVMAEGLQWASDVRNPAVLLFWTNRVELCQAAMNDQVELSRVALSGIYGHVGWSGCIMLPEELEIEVDE